MFGKLEEVEKRFEQIGEQLQEPGLADDQKRYRALMKEYADLQILVGQFREYKKTVASLAENKDLLINEKDEEMRKLIRSEIAELEAAQPRLEDELKLSLLPKDPNDDKNVIVEIRAGAGGDEASLFAEELLTLQHRRHSLSPLDSLQNSCVCAPNKSCCARRLAFLWSL